MTVRMSISGGKKKNLPARSYSRIMHVVCILRQAEPEIGRLVVHCWKGEGKRAIQWTLKGRAGGRAEGLPAMRLVGRKFEAMNRAK